MNQERIDYLDTIKAVGILLVVFCHNVLLSDDTIAGNVVMSLSWAAVPCFMMTSGALMHHTEHFTWKKYFIKLLRLYLSLAVWRLIYFVVTLSFSTVEVPKMAFLQYVFFFTDIDDIRTGVMWYMIAYFIALLLYPVTWYLFRRGGKEGRTLVLFLMVLSFLGSIFIKAANLAFSVASHFLHIHALDLSDLARIAPFSNYGNMIFYFLLGAFLFEYRTELMEKCRRFRWGFPGLILVGTIGLIAIKYIRWDTIRWAGAYVTDGYNRFSTVLISVGLFMTFQCFDVGTVGRFLGRHLGRYTMGIYYMHYVILTVADNLLYARIPFRSFGANCIKTLVLTCICLVLTRLIRKIPVVRHLVQ